MFLMYLTSAALKSALCSVENVFISALAPSMISLKCPSSLLTRQTAVLQQQFFIVQIFLKAGMLIWMMIVGNIKEDGVIEKDSVHPVHQIALGGYLHHHIPAALFPPSFAKYSCSI